MNNRGPKHESWGTPQFKSKGRERTPCTDTRWLLSDKYDLNQFRAVPRMPTSSDSLSKSSWWSTVSKAALRSKKINKVTCCLFFFHAFCCLSLSSRVFGRDLCYSDREDWLFSHWSSSVSQRSVQQWRVLPCALINTILLFDPPSCVSVVYELFWPENITT